MVSYAIFLIGIINDMNDLGKDIGIVNDGDLWLQRQNGLSKVSCQTTPFVKEDDPGVLLKYSENTIAEITEYFANDMLHVVVQSVR